MLESNSNFYPMQTLAVSSPCSISTDCLCLSDVAIHVTLLPLHIILLDQPIDILLDISYAQYTSAHRRLDDFSNEFLMRYQLSTLENANDSSLALEVAVLGNAGMSFLILFFRLFELDLVDLDTVLGMLEVRVDRERVGFIDVSASRMLRERS